MTRHWKQRNHVERKPDRPVLVPLPREELRRMVQQEFDHGHRPMGTPRPRRRKELHEQDD